jgi:hypothetical protein
LALVTIGAAEAYILPVARAELGIFLLTLLPSDSLACVTAYHNICCKNDRILFYIISSDLGETFERDILLGTDILFL